MISIGLKIPYLLNFLGRQLQEMFKKLKAQKHEALLHLSRKNSYQRSKQIDGFPSTKLSALNSVLKTF
jgi:hypothetical protein